MTSEFKYGDVVWAKMYNFPAWPALIVQPTSNTPKVRASKKPHHWVYFFGSKNYAWVREENLKPYEEPKEFVPSVQLRKAVEEVNEFIAKSMTNKSYTLQLPPEAVTQTDKKKEKDKEDADKKFNKLVSEKSPAKKTPVKRTTSERGQSVSLSKRSRILSTSPPSFQSGEENGLMSRSSIDLLNKRPDIPSPVPMTININEESELLKTKHIFPSNRKFGFIGLGNIGSGVVKNLINSGHSVNLYNRNVKKCEEIREQADATKPGLVNVYTTPMDVMQNSDIVFCCVTDPKQAKLIVHGNCGIATIEHGLVGKGYVEMTGIDPQTSKDICEIISSKGGRYLEAQVQGSKKEAEDGSLVVLTAGNKDLFMDCQSCFKAMGKMSFFLGDVGYATKTTLILNMMKGISLVGLAEGLSLADRCGISSNDILNIFQLTSLNCKYLNEKAEMIVKKDFKHVQQAIEHMQKDMKLALDLSDQLQQPLLVTSTVNEVYKHTRRLNYGGRDCACVYMRTRY